MVAGGGSRRDALDVSHGFRMLFAWLSHGKLVTYAPFSHLKHCISEKNGFLIFSHIFLRREIFFSHDFRIIGVVKS